MGIGTIITGEDKEQFDIAIMEANHDRYELIPQYAPRTTKADAIEYFQEKYTGKGKDGWKQNIVNTLSQQTGQKTKTLEKRFDTQRREKPEPKNAAQYKALGATLPPKKVGEKRIRKDRLHARFSVYIKISGDKRASRRVMSVTIGRGETQRLINQVKDSEMDLASLIQAYAGSFFNTDQVEEISEINLESLEFIV